MNHEDIIKLAREAGLGTSLCHNSVEGDRVWIEGADWHDELERFAALVEERAAAQEREECARVAAWILKMPENDVSTSIRERGMK